MGTLKGIHGIIQSIETLDSTQKEEQGCYQLLTLLQDDAKIVQFLLTSTTLLVNRITLRVGKQVTCYQDVTLPVPMIYPPRYQAIVVTAPSPYENT